MDLGDRVVLRPAGPDHELADPVRPVPGAEGVHRREPLVQVIVADEREVDAVAIEELPERACVGLVVAVGTRGQQRVMHDRDAAPRGPTREEMVQPGVLRAPARAAHDRAVRVEGDQTPIPDARRVPPVACGAGVRTEVREVPVRGPTHVVLVVTGDRVGPRELLSPAPRVRRLERLQPAVIVLLVTEREHGLGVDRLDHLLDGGGTAPLPRSHAVIEQGVAGIARDVAGRDHRHASTTARRRGHRLRARRQMEQAGLERHRSRRGRGQHHRDEQPGREDRGPASHRSPDGVPASADGNTTIALRVARSPVEGDGRCTRQPPADGEDSQ